MDWVFRRKLAGYSDGKAAAFGAMIGTAGRYGRVLTTLARTDLLIDDWGLCTAPRKARHFFSH